jgi:hypothetical protein
MTSFFKRRPMQEHQITHALLTIFASLMLMGKTSSREAFIDQSMRGEDKEVVVRGAKAVGVRG